MGDALKILSKYKEKNVRIGLDENGDNLVLKGAVSDLTRENKLELKEFKNDLLVLLKEQMDIEQLITKVPLKIGEEIPLSPSQKGIWIQCKLEKNTSLYGIPRTYDFTLEDFNFSSFRKALDNLSREHTVLKFCFSEKNGEPYQYIGDFEIDNHVSLSIYDDSNSQDDSSFLESVIYQRVSKGFEFSKQPPWSIDVVNIGGNVYKFFLYVHHLIADGATVKLLMDEIMEAYLLHEDGKEYLNTNLQYSDYVKWVLNKENFKKDLRFWGQNLTQYPEKVQLLTLRDGDNEFGGGVETYKIDSGLKTQVDHFCANNNLSSSQFYTFLFGLVLSKYGRTNDLIIGTPCESRNYPELGSIIGDMVNMLPIRISLSLEETVLHQMNKFKREYLSYLKHQLCPLEYLLEEIEYVRQDTNHPLFDIVISFPNNEKSTTDFASDSGTGEGQALFGLTLSVIEGVNTTALVFEFDKKLYSKKFIECLYKSFLSTVKNVLRIDLESSLSQVEILNEQEKTEVLSFGKQKDISALKGDVISLIGENALTFSETSALVVDSETYSYRELWNESLQFAYYLSQHDVTEGDNVLLELGMSKDFLVGLLGTWMLGGVAVPIGLGLTDIRKKQIIDVCQPKRVITHLAIEKEAIQLSSENIVSGTIAYILFTSGSTGAPKGVQISHTALMSKMKEERELFGENKRLNTIAITNVSFDVSFLETVLPLLTGGKIVIPDDAKDVNKTIQNVISESVNIIQGTPTYFSHFVNEIKKDQIEDLNQTLDFICVGGESLNGALVSQLNEALPLVKINNHYGPTETTIDAVVFENVKEFSTNIIGKPLARTTAYVLDNQLNVLPTSVVGELFVGGQSVASGYLSERELTSSKFIYHEQLKERLYATGDFAAWTNSGELRFVGRKDKQVKFRGYRIELDEINNAMQILDVITHTHVAVHGNKLICWVEGHGLNHEELRLHLSEILPEQFIPNAFVVLPKIPVNRNGKVDEKKLIQLLEDEGTYCPPETSLEIKLVDIWERVLAQKGVGIEDNFFELGGNSLNVLTIARSVLNEVGIDLPFVEIFNSNIRQIAERHKEFENSTPQSDTNVVVPFTKDKFPLASSQSNLLFYESIDISDTNSNVFLNTRIRGEVDIDLFRQTFDSLIESNDSLRITIHQDDNGGTYQKINDIESINKFFYVDRKPEDDLPSEVDKSKSEKKFDLRRFPAYELYLTQYGEEIFDISFTASHLIVDGYSLMSMETAFVRKYQELYEKQKSDNDDFDALEKTVEIPQYFDFLIEEWLYKQSAKSITQKNFWIDLFKDKDHIYSLTYLDKSKFADEGAIRRFEHTFSPSFLYRLERFSREIKVSIPNLFHAFLFLGAYTVKPNERVTVGSLFSGREEANISMLGMTLNSVVVPFDFNPDLSFSSLLSQINDLMFSVLENQNFQYEDLVKTFNKSLDEPNMPFTDVYMNLIGDFKDFKNRFFCTSPSKHESTNIEYKYDILFNISDYGSSVTCDVEYREDTLNPELIELMVQRIESYINIPLDAKVDEIVRDTYLDSFDPNQNRKVVKTTDGTGFVAFDHYYSEKNSDKATLLFVHGWCCNSDYWLGQINYLKDQFNVLAVSLLHDDSELRFRDNISLDTQVADLAQIVAEVGEPEVILIGHSSADNLILRAADVLSDKVKAIIGIDNMWGVITSAMPDEEYDELIEKPYRGNFKRHLKSRIGEWLVPGEHQAVLHEYIYQQMIMVDEDTALELAEVAYKTKSDELFNALECPIYLICSPVFEEIKEELLTKGIRDVTIIPNTSHFPFLENPKDFNETLEAKLNMIQN